MKKTIFLLMPVLFVMSLASCTDRTEGDLIRMTDAVRIDSVAIPQTTMDIYTVQTIKTYSTYSSQCEGFYGYDYLHTKPLERQVVSYKFKTDAACGDSLVRASLINFRPVETGTYTFKFWQGEDSSGNDIWLEKTIVVN